MPSDAACYMIVNQFRAWAQTATPSRRADGASALARAFLYSNLDPAQKTDALSVLTSLLDDASPLVRRAMAEAFAGAREAPHHIVLALADDQASIAAIVLARSPVLAEAELIDCAATADAVAQAAIAGRPDLTSPVAAALAEIAGADALVELARNNALTLPGFSIQRMIERHGDRAELREALLRRSDLPVSVRIDLVAATAQALAAFVSGRNWMSDERLARVTREARDRAALVIADATPSRGGALDLVAHLRAAGQLTVGFIFRAILSGKVELFKAALVDLSGLPPTRVDGLTDHCESTGFAALYRKAELPMDLLPAFRIALRAVRDVDGTHGINLSRPVIERVLTGCEAVNSGELDKLIVLLRRLESEAARDEVRAAPKLAARAAPLALRVAPAAPLRLTDLDAEDYRLPAAHGRERGVPRIEPPLFTVDMAAIEAELCAA